jgi:hypothetical protein
VACGLGFTAEQCAEDHWCRHLVGGLVGEHYRFNCPVCGKRNCLEVTVKGSSIAYRPHAHGPVSSSHPNSFPQQK